MPVAVAVGAVRRQALDWLGRGSGCLRNEGPWVVGVVLWWHSQGPVPVLFPGRETLLLDLGAESTLTSPMVVGKGRTMTGCCSCLCGRLAVGLDAVRAPAGQAAIVLGTPHFAGLEAPSWVGMDCGMVAFAGVVVLEVGAVEFVVVAAAAAGMATRYRTGRWMIWQAWCWHGAGDEDIQPEPDLGFASSSVAKGVE